MFHLYPISLYGLEKEFRAVKFLRAVKLIEEIINSSEFKLWFMTKDFTQLGDLKFVSKDLLLERLLVTVQFTYSVVKRPWYKRYSSVIGWTVNDDIHTYKDSYDRMSLPELVSHIGHELTHCSQIEFSHSFNYTKDRDDSLPYAIGSYLLKAATDKLKE